jgi:hypothetical protein
MAAGHLFGLKGLPARLLSPFAGIMMALMNAWVPPPRQTKHYPGICARQGLNFSMNKYYQTIVLLNYYLFICT